MRCVASAAASVGDASGGGFGLCRVAEVSSGDLAGWRAGGQREAF